MGNIANVVTVLSAVAGNAGAYVQLGVNVLDLINRARAILDDAEPTDDESRRQLDEANALVAQLQQTYASELEELRQRDPGSA